MSACQCHIVGRPISVAAPAEVVGDQEERKRQPVADDVEDAAALADAGGCEAGTDVDEQQFSVEREATGHGQIAHDAGPDGHPKPTRDAESSLAGAGHRLGMGHYLWG